MRSKRNRITIKDVAKETGVSISTVSNVLNKSRYVKKETEEQILEAVKKLNYRPNMVARGLRLKSTGSVGVIVPDISNPFFAEMVRGMENVARKLGYTLILCCTYYDTEEEERQLNLLRDKWVDGFIFASGYNTDDHIAELMEQKIAVVAVDREITDFWVPSVLIDNVEAAKKAVQAV
jgi:LacI family transcriptional regulator